MIRFVVESHSVCVHYYLLFDHFLAFLNSFEKRICVRYCTFYGSYSDGTSQFASLSRLNMVSPIPVKPDIEGNERSIQSFRIQ